MSTGYTEHPKKNTKKKNNKKSEKRGSCEQVHATQNGKKVRF